MYLDADGPAPVPTINGCYLTDSGTPILFLAFLILLFHEISGFPLAPTEILFSNVLQVVMVITLVIGYKKYRNHRTPLIRTLYRDGTIYFVLIFGETSFLRCEKTGLIVLSPKRYHSRVSSA